MIILTAMNKKFEFEFIDQSSENTISFEYDDDIEEEIDVQVYNERLFLYANRQAFFALAKAFIKMAMGNYKDGFHIHIRKNFEANQPEIICCVLKNKI